MVAGLKFFLVALAGMLLAQEQVQYLDLRVRHKILLGKQRPALIVIPRIPLKSIKVELTRSDGKVLKFSARGLKPGREKEFTWQQPAGEMEYKGRIEVVARHGGRGEREVAFTVLVQGPLEIRIPREKVDLEAHTLDLILSRPAGRAEITVTGDRGEHLGGAEIEFQGEPAGTPLSVSWEQREGVVIMIEVRAYDTESYHAGMKLFPWSVEIPHQEVVFDFGSHEIRPSEEPKLDDSYRLLKEAVDRYGKIVQVQLYIAGYTDTVAGEAYNLKLSRRRARAIARALRRRGVAFPIYYQGFGEEVLAVITPDETPEEKNRRAIYLLTAETPPVSPTLPRSDWTLLK